MGLYGSMLTYFAGQFRDFTYFNQNPKINSGYTFDPLVPIGKYRGVLQNSTSDIEDSNGHLTNRIDEFLWTEANLQVGFFVIFLETTYRIVPSNDWKNEGGFTRYTIKREVGDNGTPDTNNYTLGLGGTPV